MIPLGERRGSSPSNWAEQFAGSCPTGINPAARRRRSLLALVVGIAAFCLTPSSFAQEPTAKPKVLV